MLKTVSHSLMSQVVRYYHQFKGASKDQKYWNKGAVGGTIREEGPLNLCWTEFTCLQAKINFALLSLTCSLQSCETATIESEADSQAGWALYSRDSRQCSFPWKYTFSLTLPFPVVIFMDCLTPEVFVYPDPTEPSFLVSFFFSYNVCRLDLISLPSNSLIHIS